MTASMLLSFVVIQKWHYVCVWYIFGFLRRARRPTAGDRSPRPRAPQTLLPVAAPPCRAAEAFLAPAFSAPVALCELGGILSVVIFKKRRW